MKKYKYDSPLCEECGGKIIEDGERICSNCGLVEGPVLKLPKIYSNSVQNEMRKQNNESTHLKEYHRIIHNKAYREQYQKDFKEKIKENNKKYYKDKRSVAIKRSVQKRFAKYCKKNKLKQAVFLTILLTETLDLLEDDQNG